MTDNQIRDVLAALTRIAIVFERIADGQFGAARIVDSPAIAHNAPVSAPAAESPVAALLSASTPAAAQEPILYDTVRAAVNAYADRHGEHAAQAIIKGFGATYIKDLKATPEKFAAVLAALK